MFASGGRSVRLWAHLICQEPKNSPQERKSVTEGSSNTGTPSKHLLNRHPYLITIPEPTVVALQLCAQPLLVAHAQHIPQAINMAKGGSVVENKHLFALREGSVYALLSDADVEHLREDDTVVCAVRRNMV